MSNQKTFMRILWQVTTNFGIGCSRASVGESRSEDGCCYAWIHNSLLLQLLKPALLLVFSLQPSAVSGSLVSAQSHTVTSPPRSKLKLVSVIWLQWICAFWLSTRFQNV